jgi:hypothetical protein
MSGAMSKSRTKVTAFAPPSGCRARRANQSATPPSTTLIATEINGIATPDAHY